MLILALDTTLAACSAALCDSARDRVIAEKSEAMRQGHAERLAGMVDEVVNEAGTKLTELDRIAVTTGPGTFTGVRIGLALAQGMARALEVPLVGISTLQALAANVNDNPDGLPVCVVMDARREAVYTQTFAADLGVLNAAECMPLRDLMAHLGPERCILVGSGVNLITDPAPGWQIDNSKAVPQAGLIARLAQEMPDNADLLPLPLYLRPADAKPQAQQVKFVKADMEVTDATCAHAAALSGIHAECFAAGWQSDDMNQILSSPGVVCRIANVDGEPTGFIVTRQAADEAEIITLCVRPAWRRRGIARQLLEPVLKALAGNGVDRMFLEVRSDNVAAKALYSGAGFSEAGVRRDYYKLDDGSRMDALIMAKTLNHEV